MAGNAYAYLMRIFSRPRPPGSPGERATVQAVRSWLDDRGIPHRVHTFPLYPYFFESIGLWIILSRTALVLAVILRAGWTALGLAFLGLLGGVVDILLGWPVVTWPGRRKGENIVIEFSSPCAGREVVLCAHYDSKTELLDHRQRALFVEHTRLWSALTLLVGALAPLVHYLDVAAPRWSRVVYEGNVALAILLGIGAWGLGLHLSLGRVVKPSSGAVDDGAACAVLLRLAERLARAGLPDPATRVTIVLFAGEEANMQGSRAYVRSRPWPLPARVVNLELLGQDGEYVLWEEDGDAFRRATVPQDVRTWVVRAVYRMTGRRPQLGGRINSDGFSFLRAGIPTATLGTLDRHWGTRGLHRPTDRPERVDLGRLPEHEDLLWALLSMPWNGATAAR